MMPHEPLREIMRRTMRNLEFIETRRGADGPYEVTQLLNSFLGALAHPWEAYRTELAARPFGAAAADGWPTIAKERPRDRDPDSLGDLVRLMRNAAAHGNLEFLPGPAGDIRALRVWNIDRGHRTWGAIITVADMRAFLVRFVALAEELHEGRIRAKSRTV